MFAVFKRDLFSYFTTPVGYVFMAIFLAVNGGIFSMNTLQLGTESSLSGYFTTMMLLFVILIPILTMKTFSEEKKQKTEQLLMTSPVSIGGMVFGKFLAAYTIFAGTFLLGCFNFVAIDRFASDPPNWASIWGSVIALLLLGMAFVAIGVFVSALTENQFIAILLTAGVMGAFLVIGLYNTHIPFAPLREALSWLSVYSRFGNFNYGILDFAALLYYVSITFVFLFLTVRVFEKRRWA